MVLFLGTVKLAALLLPLPIVADLKVNWFFLQVYVSCETRVFTTILKLQFAPTGQDIYITGFISLRFIHSPSQNYRYYWDFFLRKILNLLFLLLLLLLFFFYGKWSWAPKGLILGGEFNLVWSALHLLYYRNLKI